MAQASSPVPEGIHQKAILWYVFPFLFWVAFIYANWVHWMLSAGTAIKKKKIFSSLWKKKRYIQTDISWVYSSLTFHKVNPSKEPAPDKEKEHFSTVGKFLLLLVILSSHNLRENFLVGTHSLSSNFCLVEIEAYLTQEHKPGSF